MIPPSESENQECPDPPPVKFFQVVMSVVLFPDKGNEQGVFRPGQSPAVDSQVPDDHIPFPVDLCVQEFTHLLDGQFKRHIYFSFMTR